MVEKLGAQLRPPAWLVHEGQHRIVLFLNHVLAQEPEATSRLVRQKGSVVLVQWRAFSLRLVGEDARYVERPGPTSPPHTAPAVPPNSPYSLSSHFSAPRRT